MTERLSFQNGKGYKIDSGWTRNEQGKRLHRRWWLGHDEQIAEALAGRIRSEWVTAKATSDCWPTDTLQRLQKMVSDAKAGKADWQSPSAPTPTTPATPAETPAAPAATPTAAPVAPAAAPAVTPLPSVANGWQLYAAIDDWCQSELNRNGISPAQRRKPMDSLHWVKRFVPDKPLLNVGYEDVHKLTNEIKGRPTSNVTKRPISVDTAGEILKHTKRFLEVQEELGRWHRCLGFVRCFDFDRKAALTVPELKQRARKPTFSLKDLSELYRMGFPLQRLYLLLGLLGFYQSDIGSLTKDEVMSRDAMLGLLKDYGWNDDEVAAMKAASQPGDSFIVRFRTKTGNWGCWLLWPETYQLLKHLEAADNDKGENATNLQLLGGKGNPLWHWQRSKTDVIEDHWLQLVERYDGPRLTLKYLRKTGGNLIARHTKSDSLAQLLLAQSDGQSVARRHYLNKDFAELTTVIRELHSYLQPIFCGVKATAGGVVTRAEKQAALKKAGLTL